MFIVTKEIDSENITKLCRTCLREDGEKMVCLFSGPAGSSLAAKLRTLSCLEVWQGDGLPEKLCDRCVTRAESALLYREQCRAADLALRQAASKVCRAALDATLSTSKIYQHPKHDFTPIQNSHKSVKCTECEALFSSYQELCVHARAHLPFVQDNRPVQHMNIVESQNSLGYMGALDGRVKASEVLPNSFIASDIVQTISPSKNDRAACALHCSLCNHTFTNRTQLINHHGPVHCHEEVESSCDNENSIVHDDPKIHDLQSSNFQQSIDHSVHAIQNLSYPRDEVAINYSAHMTLNSTDMGSNDESRLGGPNTISQDQLCSDLSNDTCNEQVHRFTGFDEVGMHHENERHYEARPEIFKESSIAEISTSEKKHYRCTVCDKSFAQKSKLASHILHHTGEKPFACHTCDKAYTSKSKLKAHMRLHTQTNVHRCPICDKTFPYPSYLAEHVKIHDSAKNASNRTRTKEFECTMCNKQFHLLKNLKVHLRLHTGKGLMRCEFCHKAFGQKYNLKIHLRTHSMGGKFIKCNYCDKSFSARGNYVEHLRIHTKVKPFKCRVCNKSFSQSSHLKTHEASHDSSRPHQCRLCGKRYKLAAHLRRHAETHTTIKSHKCELCDQMFSQAFSLKRHLKKHNEAQI